MADRTWDNGAGTRVVATAANWSADTAPISNDRAFFTSENTSAGTGPNTTMNGLTAVDLDLLHVTGGYTEQIGTTGDPFEISADRVVHEGQNTLFYEDGGGLTDSILVDVSRSMALTTLALELSGSTTTLLTLLRGWASVLASAAVTTINAGQAGSATAEAKLTIATGCTLTTIRTYGCTANCSSAVATLEVGAGSVWTQDTAAVGSTDLIILPGSRVNLNFTGTYVNVHWVGGIIDISKGGPKTFTNLWRGVKNDRRDAQNTIIGEGLLTVTNEMI